MPGLVPGNHVFLRCRAKDVVGRDKPGHDEVERSIPASVGMTSRHRVDRAARRIALRRERFTRASLGDQEGLNAAEALSND